MSDNTNNEHPTDRRLAQAPTSANWERETLEKLVFATIKEQRAARRWSIFFRLTFLVLAAFVIWEYFDLGGPDRNRRQHRHRRQWLGRQRRACARQGVFRRRFRRGGAAHQ
jgi:hypothetical protein